MPRRHDADQPSTSRAVFTKRPTRRTQLSEDSASDSNEKTQKARKSRKPSKPRKQQSSDESESDRDNRSKKTKKSRKSRANESESGTENFDISQYTQPKKIDKKELVNNMVKMLLNYSAKKVLIKKQSDVEIFKLCKQQMIEVYGLEITEVQSGKTKGLIIHSALNSGITALQFPPEIRNEITLLLLILSYIFMKGCEVQEGENFFTAEDFDKNCFLSVHLAHFLDQLHIDVNETHNVFGDVGKLIDKFTRQLYLKRSKVEIEGMNEPQNHISWGPRAEKEFDKKEILKTVADIMNKSPAMFIKQYHEVMQEGGENNDEDVLMIE